MSPNCIIAHYHKSAQTSTLFWCCLSHLIWTHHNSHWNSILHAPEHKHLFHHITWITISVLFCFVLPFWFVCCTLTQQWNEITLLFKIPHHSEIIKALRLNHGLDNCTNNNHIHNNHNNNIFMLHVKMAHKPLSCAPGSHGLFWKLFPDSCNYVK